MFKFFEQLLVRIVSEVVTMVWDKLLRPLVSRLVDRVAEKFQVALGLA